MTNNKRLKLTTAICSWIAKCERPIGIVEDKDLEEVLQIAAECSSYTLPSRYVVTKTLTDQYEHKRQTLLNQIYTLEADSVGITLDYWTSVANESYLGITCHFIQMWDLHSRTLAVKHCKERHTSDHVKTQIEQVIEDWGLTGKVSALVTDNAANMVKAAKFLPFPSFTCAAHTLQLAVNKALKDCNVEPTLSKLRKIVGHFKHSAISLEELKSLMQTNNEKRESLVSNSICNHKHVKALNLSEITLLIFLFRSRM